MDIAKLLSVGVLTFLLSFGQTSPASLASSHPPSSQAQTDSSAVSAENGDTSRNWAGYATTGGIITSVTGSWIVPQVQGDNPGVDATWVGIGGIASHDLIQAGTQTTVNRQGRIFYQAFFETLPEPATPLNLAVTGGDTVTVTVAQKSLGIWQISLKNNTSGQSLERTEIYDSSLTSAEWIEEQPSGLRRMLPLNNFGTVQFLSGSTVKDGRVLNIAQANSQAITMINSFGQRLARTSGIGGDGSSFSVTRMEEVSSLQPPQFVVVYRHLSL